MKSGHNPGEKKRQKREREREREARHPCKPVRCEAYCFQANFPFIRSILNSTWKSNHYSVYEKKKSGEHLAWHYKGTKKGPSASIRNKIESWW